MPEFFFSDIFPNPTTVTEEVVTEEFDSEKLQKPKPWVPKLRTGFFYLGDRQYYLYDKKASCYLADLTWTRIRLNSNILEGTESVSINGLALPRDAYSIRGHFLDVNHGWLDTNGLLVRSVEYDISKTDPSTAYSGIRFGPNDYITITGDSFYWDSASNGFASTTVNQTSALADGDKYFKFPGYVNRFAPVVITDDSIPLHHRDKIAPEFNIDDDGNLTFNYTPNLLFNWKFDSDKDYWVCDSNVTALNANSSYPERQQSDFNGTTFLSIPVNETIAQKVRVPYSRSLMLQVVARSYSGSSVEITIEGFDLSKTSLGSDTITFSCIAGNDWTDNQFVLGKLNEIVSSDADLPEGARYLEITIESTSGTTEISSVYLSNSSTFVDHYEPNETSTVEYEIGEGKYYIHDPEIRWGIDALPHSNEVPLVEVNISPIMSSKNDGFLYFDDVDTTRDIDYSLGGLVYDEDAGTSTYSIGRKNFPFAKTRGPKKLVETGVFGLTNPQWFEESTEPLRTQETAEILIDYGPHTVLATSEGSNPSLSQGTLLYDISADNIEIPFTSAHGVYGDEGYISVTNPATGDLEAHRFVARDTQILKLERPIGYALSAGANIDITYPKITIPSNGKSDVIAEFLDEYGCAVPHLEPTINVIYRSGFSNDLLVSVLNPQTNSEGRVKYSIESLTGNTSALVLEITANGITRRIDVEVL